MSDDSPLVFRGVDGRESEAFIRSVKSRAFSTGKQRDYEWMADFASTCFEGDGLRWFCGLDDETQGNWKLLERALLRDFPRSSDAAAPSSSTIPTAPAAAPPPPPFASYPPSSTGQAPTQLPRDLPALPPRGAPTFAPHSSSLLRGHLKLVFDDGGATRTAYIKTKPDPYGYCSTTSSADDALRIAYKPSEDRVELLVIDRDNLAQGDLFGAKRVGDKRLKRAYLVVGSDIGSGESRIWLVKPGRTTSFLPRLVDADGAVMRVDTRDRRPVIQWGPPASDSAPAPVLTLVPTATTHLLLYMGSASSPEPFDLGSPPPYVGAESTVTLPSYSAELRPQEQTLQSQPLRRRPSNGAESLSMSEYIYSTKYMTLNLGRNIYGTEIPSYGRNGIITGTLTVSDFKYTKEVSLSILGKVTVVVNHPSVPIPPERRTVLLHTETLWSASESTPRPEPPQTLRISFPLPSYARGCASLLPPSISSYSSSIELDVRYSLTVDMSRQGIHRNQTINTGFHYLPKSTPAHPLEVQVAPGSAGGKTDEETEGLRWKMVETKLDAPITRQDGSVVRVSLHLRIRTQAGF
ncbi:hypothetical protein FRC01_001490 [Tulasnella sp. 417]|nr:hypothetical protein FRC01_001490 [Tulasnella sp. 417]